MATVSYETMNASQLVASEAKPNRRGGIFVPLSVRAVDGGGIEPILCQTPRLRAPFGISCYDESADAPRYSLPLSLEGPDGETFADFLQTIDTFVLDTAARNSAKWFKGKQHSRELLEELYHPLFVAPPVGSQYAPLFRSGKLKSFGKEIKSPCFDKERTQVDMRQTVTGGSEVSVYFEITSIWFNPTSFGVTTVFHQVLAWPRPQHDKFAFQINDESVCSDDCSLTL